MTMDEKIKINYRAAEMLVFWVNSSEPLLYGKTGILNVVQGNFILTLIKSC
jgi:hypothetical protein